MLFNNIFKAKSIDLYKSNSIQNISFTSYNSSSTITLMSTQLHKPSLVDLKITSHNLLFKIYGAKLYIPYKDLLIVVTGYLIKDNFKLYKEHPILKKKYDHLCKITTNINMPKAFIKNYLQKMTLKQLVVYSNKTILEYMLEDFLFLNNIKNRNISNVVKDFLLCDTFKQYRYIKMLTLDKNNEDNNYIAYLLYDLIDSNHSMTHNKNKSNNIYNCLSWSVQKNIKNAHKIISKQLNKITDFNEMDIPYEQRIILLKTSNEIKNKALTKLKELKSGKNGESNSKARQYLDGLLKIPFGVYKEPSILVHKQKYTSIIINSKRTILEYITELEETYKLDDDSLDIINTIRTILSHIHKKINICNIQRFTQDLQKLYTTLVNKKKNILSYYTILKKKKINVSNIYTLSLKTLKIVCASIGLRQRGKKQTLIDKIIKKMRLQDKDLYHIMNIDIYTHIV